MTAERQREGAGGQPAGGAPSAVSPSDRSPISNLTAGMQIAGRFRLIRPIGEGGMGVVWEATHEVTRRPLALKFLKRTGNDDARAVTRFFREARAACAVHHPSVVVVHDVLALDDGTPLMVMDLLSGETLAARLARLGRVPLSELAGIMVHVCSAVGCAHALGIVHRDLKPENIFLAETASGAREVKVLDFGIAKLTAQEGTAAQSGVTTGTGTIVGTPFYMAPEQLCGEKDIDHRADLWALGIILYEALAGERPTQADNLGQIYKTILTDSIVPLRRRAPELPKRVLDLVQRLLSGDKSRRPPDASAVLEVLAEYTRESYVGISSPPAAPLSDSADRRGEEWAPTVAVTPRASGIVVPPRSGASAGAGSRSWVAMTLVGAAIAAAGGVGLWVARSSATSTTSPTPPASSPPGVSPEPAAVLAPAAAPAPVSSSAAVTGARSAAASTAASPASRRWASPAAVARGGSAGGGSVAPGPSGKGGAAPAATTATSAGGTPSKPQPPADPGSYQ